MPAQRKKQPAKKKQAAKRKAPAKKKAPVKKHVAPKREVSFVQPPKRRFASGVCTLYAQALSLLHQKKHKPASQQFNRLIERFPGEIAIIARARSFLRICDRHLPAPEKDTAHTPEEIFNQGVFYHNDGRYDKALGDYSRALKLSKKNNDHIYYAMAATELSMGNAENALKHLEKAIQLNEENRYFANNDPDFEPLATNNRFRNLLHPD